ncbi:hypothetical protein IWX84_001045 [Flavobacterium sp. CG_9.10]|nr:hypothetical protein [Flavobacterium sp. CG_9.10]
MNTIDFLKLERQDRIHFTILTPVSKAILYFGFLIKIDSKK